MVTLSVGIRNLRAADPHDVIADFRVDERRSPQREPIPHLPARDHIVNRCGRKMLVIQVPVQHTRELCCKCHDTSSLTARSSSPQDDARAPKSRYPRIVKKAAFSFILSTICSSTTFFHTAGATGSIPVSPTNLGSSEGHQELPEAENPWRFPTLDARAICCWALTATLSWG